MSTSWCCCYPRKKSTSVQPVTELVTHQNPPSVDHKSDDPAVLAQSALAVIIPKEIGFDIKLGEKEKLDGSIQNILEVIIPAKLNNVSFYHSLIEKVFKPHFAEGWYTTGSAFVVRLAVTDDLKKKLSDTNSVGSQVLNALQEPVNLSGAHEKNIEKFLQGLKHRYPDYFVPDITFDNLVYSLKSLSSKNPDDHKVTGPRK